MSRSCNSCDEYLLSDAEIVIEIPQGDAVCAEIHTSLNYLVEVEKETLVIEFPDTVVIQEGTGNSENSESIICSHEAGEQINVNRAVSIGTDGRIYHADKDDDELVCDIVGVTRQSGSIGSQVEIIKFGKLMGATFGPIGANLYLGNVGQLTETPPTSGMWLYVGTQVGATEFFVKIGEPIRRL